jgi:hypothetical protein
MGTFIGTDESEILDVKEAVGGARTRCCHGVAEIVEESKQTNYNFLTPLQEEVAIYQSPPYTPTIYASSIGISSCVSLHFVDPIDLIPLAKNRSFSIALLPFSSGTKK